MQTKQFTGDTIDDVLDQVRGAFGDDAVILETRNVVRGGFAGFFGRSGIEVTAADRMPAPGGGRGVDLLDTATGAAGGDGRDAPMATDEFLRRLGEHLASPAPVAPATPAAPAAQEDAPAAQQVATDDDERERARAIIEAARAAVRDAAAEAAPAAAPAAADEGFVAGGIAAATPAAAMPAAAPAAVAAPVAAPATPAPATPAPATPAPAAGVDADAEPSVDAAARPLPMRAEVARVRDELAGAGVDDRRLDALLDGFQRSVAPFLDPAAETRAAVRDYLAARMPVVRDWRPWRGAHAIALVGQSGVGKSATAVKIAGRHAAAGLDVAIIAAGAAARGPLADWARALDITVVEADGPDAVRAARERLGARDLVVVDTPGCSATTGDGVDAVRALLDAAGADEVHLVLAAATPAADLGDLQAAFRPLGVNRITVTKLDETRRCGGLLNAPMRIGRPLAFIADGAAMPGAIAPADPRMVAELLLP